MMDEFKNTMKGFFHSFDYLPEVFKTLHIIRLVPGKFEVKMKQPMIILGNLRFLNETKHRWQEYNFETFFLKKRIPDCQCKEVMDAAKEYILFKRLHENQKISAREIMNCKNLELRRALLERFGYEKMLNELGGHMIDAEGNYILFKMDFREVNESVKLNEDVKLLKMKDSSTERWYVLRVPPNVKNCTEAVSWSFNTPVEEYKLEVET